MAPDTSQALVFTEGPENQEKRMLLPEMVALSGPTPQVVVGAPAGNLALNLAAPVELRASRAVSRSGSLGVLLPVSQEISFRPAVAAWSKPPPGVVVAGMSSATLE